MNYRHIDPQPLSGAIGAEVRGVDLAYASDDVWDEIHALYLDRIALFFPGQTLNPTALADVVSHFGPVGKYPFSPGLPEEPRVFSLVKEPHETKNFGEGWHTDTTYTDIPPKATALYSVETPPAGGDTLFANMYLAYDALSDGLKETLAGLRAVHSTAVRRGGGRAVGNSYQSVKLSGHDKAVLEAVHPLVRTHPINGRKVIYVDALHTARIEGWTDAESQPLLEYLYQCQQRTEFTCRYQWEPNVLAVWDNCAAQHLAVNDYHGHRREMYRLSIAGERPV